MPEEAAMEAVQGMGGGEELGGLGAGLGAEGGIPEEGVPEEGGEDVEQLAAILEELGISPEELEQAMAAEEGGGLEGAGLEGAGLEGGGLGGGGLEGGLPEEAPPEEAAGLEVEAADKRAAAKKGSAGNAVKDYIQEIIARSRR